MRLRLALPALLAIAGSAHAADITVILDHLTPTSGSGNVKTETRSVSGFDSVLLKGSTDVDIRQGNETRVEVTADDNLLPMIATELQGHTLVVEAKHSYRTNNQTRVSITMPALKAVDVNGSGDIVLKDYAGERLHLGVAGSGDIDARGSVGELDAKIDGSGDIDAGSLKARSVHVQINGSGDAHVAASDALDATVNGSGDVGYRGSPAQLRQVVHGSGEVSKE